METTMKRFDVTFCRQGYPGSMPMTIEADAVGEEEACELVRGYFATIYRQHVTVTTITAHKPRKPKPVTITVKMREMI
jgi:hypothetical protein